MELSRFLRPSILKFDDWFINVSIGGAGGEDSNIQKNVYFSGKNAYLYASTGSGVTELHIFGNSVQDGTPSIENPVPIISVGENYLQLYSLDINDPSKSGQIIDFGNIKLRSLPNGVCDEIVYQNGQWKYIQRIVSIIIDKNTTIQDQLAASNRVTIQVNYTLITKASANNTNFCSKISNSASSVPRFHNYPNTIYVVWDSNKPATFEEAKSLIMGAEFLCELAEPVETILDLPKLQTLNGTTYLLTNDQQVKPYLQGYYDVDTTISGKKIEYVQDGMLSWWQPFGLTNADKPTVIPDKLGNSDLTIKNIGYTNESGFNPTYLQLDGIDDYLTNIGNFEPEHIKHMQVTLSNLFKESAVSYWFSIFDKDGTDFQGIANDRHLFEGPSDVTVVSFLNGVKKDGINASYFKEIYDNNSDDIYCLGIQNNVDAVNFTALNIGTTRNSISYISKERFYEAVAYNRVLSGEEIENNFLVSQVRNGVNIPDSVDPIDIISTPTYGSGKAFPIYNTYIDKNNNNVESLIICGYTEQDGTPTPENPIELKSVGDQSLVLCIYNEDKSKVQYIDFGDIVLRSLPDGTCDSIEWDGKNWRHVQRVWRINLSNAYYHNTTAKFAIANLNPTYGGLHNNPNYVMSNRFVIGSFEDMSNNIGISYINAVNSTYAFNFENEPGTNEHVREWLADNPTELIYKLSTPIETILEGIPAPQTYDQVTYFSTPNTEVRPYIMATVKAIKPLEYQGDISAWWYFGGNKSNETDRQITDISGNGNDLTPYNFAWTRESGYDQSGIRSDGVDDVLNSYNSFQVRDALITISDFEKLTGDNKTDVILGIRTTNEAGARYTNRFYFDDVSFKITSDEVLSLKPSGVPTKDAYKTNYFLITSNDDYDDISLFSLYPNTSYISKGVINELILFSNHLADNQYNNNINVAKQRNGIEDYVNFTATASGKKFPIYYTIEGDTIKELHIYGESMQEGTPTHDTPQEIYSSGDEGLKLCVTDSETGNALQVIDFGNIVLRSLPSGIRDEIVYKDGTWTYIQRVDTVNTSNVLSENIKTAWLLNERNVLRLLVHNIFPAKADTISYCNKASWINTRNPSVANSIGIVVQGSNYNEWRFGVQGITIDDPLTYLQGYNIYYELNSYVETTLDLPDITTYADITYIGTPNAKVKPYIECVAETYKPLEFVKDGLVELYDFAPSKWQDNKIYNEIDNSQYITANNFNNTVESGAFSNYTQFDGTDDYFTDNNNVDSIFVQTYVSDIVDITGTNQRFYSLGTTEPAPGLFLTTDKRITFYGGSVSIDTSNKVTIINENLWGTGIHSYQGFLESSNKLSVIGRYVTSGSYCKHKLYALLTYSSELTSEQIEHNRNCFKQFKGVDGDINIIPEPDVYYDFSLYNNTDFPSEIENLASDKNKALQLFNFAGTEESGFFEGALVSDGVDDYAIIQNDKEGFRTVFMQVNPMSAKTMLYDQRIHGFIEEAFAIYLYADGIAYNARNPGGITYINGILNESILVRDLLNNKHIITIVNDSSSYIPYVFSSNTPSLFTKAKTFKFLGFKEALTAEQIQEVINQYFSEVQLLDSQGNELTDSQGYYLTVAS